MTEPRVIKITDTPSLIRLGELVLAIYPSVSAESPIPTTSVKGGAQRAARYKAPLPRALSAYGIAALEVCLRELGLDPSDYSIEAKNGEKPRLLSLSEDITAPHFSISHSGSVALCLVCAADEVGVDLEIIPRSTEKENIHRKVARRRFSPRELAEIDASPSPELEFLRIWCAHEAAGKLLGVGLLQGDAKETAAELSLSLEELRLVTEEDEYLLCLCTRAG